MPFMSGKRSRLYHEDRSGDMPPLLRYGAALSLRARGVSPRPRQSVQLGCIAGEAKSGRYWQSPDRFQRVSRHSETE